MRYQNTGNLVANGWFRTKKEEYIAPFWIILDNHSRVLYQTGTKDYAGRDVFDCRRMPDPSGGKRQGAMPA
jgi:hypothetical protein